MSYDTLTHAENPAYKQASDKAKYNTEDEQRRKRGLKIEDELGKGPAECPSEKSYKTVKQ
jgi:hypothetical protein